MLSLYIYTHIYIYWILSLSIYKYWISDGGRIISANFSRRLQVPHAVVALQANGVLDSNGAERRDTTDFYIA